jgi:hypothetical protein
MAPGHVTDEGEAQYPCLKTNNYYRDYINIVEEKYFRNELSIIKINRSTSLSYLFLSMDIVLLLHLSRVLVPSVPICTCDFQYPQR